MSRKSQIGALKWKSAPSVMHKGFSLCIQVIKGQIMHPCHTYTISVSSLGNLQTPIMCPRLNITKTARWQQIHWIKSLSAQGAAYHRHWYNNICICVGYSVGQCKACAQASILFNWVIKLRIVAQRMLNCVYILKEVIRRKLHSWKHVDCFMYWRELANVMLTYFSCYICYTYLSWTEFISINNVSSRTAFNPFAVATPHCYLTALNDRLTNSLYRGLLLSLHTNRLSVWWQIFFILLFWGYLAVAIMFRFTWKRIVDEIYGRIKFSGLFSGGWCCHLLILNLASFLWSLLSWSALPEFEEVMPSHISYKKSVVDLHITRQPITTEADKLIIDYPSKI